ncbi:MAG TPA: type II toxin-antitoxin system HicB family antitoxin [Ignavibacteria bacterium]|nr:type II toxin-antitoxin system HicB family antitoxin [Ignavibacteria bacterium]HQY51871.1 type II toxin-antitoxin system HicB family antitoxin [Ignavibacteria bacterium]HRB00375.1 type II toxin-antitoxin system HicB family antitoxin [Ignavibacteria bacterium]
MKKEYLIIIEKGKNSYSAYIPDLPGCIATSDSEKNLLKLMEEGIELHIKDMKKRGYKIPLPTTKSAVIETAA